MKIRVVVYQIFNSYTEIEIGNLVSEPKKKWKHGNNTNKNC